MNTHTTRTRSMRFATKAFAATLLIAGLCAGISAGALGQGTDVYAQLKTYDLQNRTALLAIQKLVQDANGDAAKQAVIETGLLGVLSDEASTFSAKQAACKFLWMVGSGASVPALAKLLPDDKYNDVARYALERNLDPSAGAALRDALRTCKGLSLVGVVNSIGDRADANAVGALKGLAGNADPLVSGSAINALGKVGTPTAVSVLKGLMASNPAASRALVTAAAGLAASGKAKEAEALYLSLAGKGSSREMRGVAVVAVAALGSRRAVAVALDAAKSDDIYLQRIGGQVLGAFADLPTTNATVAAWASLPPAAKIALLASFAERRESGATSIALQAAASTDPEMRMAGIRAAGRVGGADAVEPLAVIAASDSGAVSQAARESLAMLSGRPAARAMNKLARDGKPEIRAALMTVFGELRTPDAKNALQAAAKDSSSPAVAVEALKSIARFGAMTELPVVVQVLVATTRDDIRDAAQGAVVACAQRSEDRNAAVGIVAAPLAAASVPAKISLLQALAQLGGARALQELTAAAADKDADVKQAAVTSLAETWGDSGALPVLGDLAKSSDNKSLRVVALRGYLRLVGQTDSLKPDEKVALIVAAIGMTERPDEKRLALSVLRDCRVPAAVEAVAKLLDDTELFDESADAVLYLAAPQKKDRTDLPAVKGAEMTAALDKVVKLAKDDALRQRAEKLR